MIKPIVIDFEAVDLVAGPAIPVEILTDLGGIPVEGKLQRVRFVTQAEMAALGIKPAGGRPIAVVLTTSNVGMVGGPAMLVYDATTISPIPPPPVVGQMALVMEGTLTALALEGTLTALVME